MNNRTLSQDDRKLIADEFPDFDLETIPPIPAGFECTAWHNDACPLWQEGDSTVESTGLLQIGIDYEDDARRECSGGERFSVFLLNGGGSDEFCFTSDDWSDIELMVAFARYVRRFGLGFHVDTRGRSYVNGDGTRTLTPTEADEYDRVIEAAHALVDPYEAAISLWKALGLLNGYSPS